MENFALAKNGKIRTIQKQSRNAYLNSNACKHSIVIDLPPVFAYSPRKSRQYQQSGHSLKMHQPLLRARE